MEKGKIVFLNGVTSTGKTSIVDAIQSQSEVFFYVVANDLFEEMVGDRYLRENYWKYLSEAIIMMYHTARLFSDQGKNVLIDGILVEEDQLKPHYETVKTLFAGYPLDIVEIYCPLEICRKRNIARGDRGEEQSAWQHSIMASNIDYRYSVDTSVLSPGECADEILNAIFAGNKAGQS